MDMYTDEKLQKELEELQKIIPGATMETLLEFTDVKGDDEDE